MEKYLKLSNWGVFNNIEYTNNINLLDNQKAEKDALKIISEIIYKALNKLQSWNIFYFYFYLISI